MNLRYKLTEWINLTKSKVNDIYDEAKMIFRLIDSRNQEISERLVYYIRMYFSSM